MANRIVIHNVAPDDQSRSNLALGFVLRVILIVGGAFVVLAVLLAVLG